MSQVAFGVQRQRVLTHFFAIVVASLITTFSTTARAQTPQPQLLVAGPNHTIAIRDDGKLFAWGKDDYGQLGTKRTLVVPTAQQLSVNARFKQVSASAGHIAALDIDGSVWTWGTNIWNRLGDRGNIDDAVPAKVIGLPKIRQVVAGSANTVALAESGEVYQIGQLADETAIGIRFSPKPQKIPGLTSIIKVATGSNVIFALRADGVLFSLGNSFYGLLAAPGGTPEESATPIRVAIAEPVAQIYASLCAATAVTRTGKVLVWGGCSGSVLVQPTQLQGLPAGSVVQITGQVGLMYRVVPGQALPGSKLEGMLYTVAVTNTTPTAVPYESSNNNKVIEVNSGNGASYAIRANGDVYAAAIPSLFGGASEDAVNADGALGIGSTTTVTTGGLLTRPAGFRPQQIAGGRNFAVAIDANGALWGWGSNRSGVLVADAPMVLRPNTNSGQSFLGVAAGQDFTIAYDANGRGYGWGNNAFLALGLPDRRSYSATTRNDGTNVIGVAAGAYTAYWLTSAGDVFFTGVNPTNSDFSFSANFSRVAYPEPIQKISAQSNTLIALSRTGKLYGWGANGTGQAGVNSASPYITTPTLIGLPVLATDVASGRSHSVVIGGGTVFAWGAGFGGVLCRGNTNNAVAPAAISNTSYSGTATGIGASTSGTYILTAQQAYGCGDNSFGQLGASGTNALTPLAINSLSPIRQVVGTATTTTALRDDGVVVSMGTTRGDLSQQGGALGDGTLGRRTSFVAVQREDRLGNLDNNNWALNLKANASPDLTPFQQKILVEAVSSGTTSPFVTARIRPRAADEGTVKNIYVTARVPRAFLPVAAGIAKSQRATVAAKSGLSSGGEVNEIVNEQPYPLNSLDAVLSRITAKAALPLGNPPLNVQPMADSDLVLVQLTPTGWQVVTSQLTALTTGVISGNGSAATILNNINLNLIPGSQFCIGYGNDPSAMLANQTLTEVLAIPGAASTSGGTPCLKSGAYITGPDRSKPGDSVTFTGTVIGLAPSGAVALRDSGNTLQSTNIAVQANQAVQGVTFTINNLATGARTLTTFYAGDNTNSASTSAPLTHAVRPTTTVTLTAKVGAGVPATSITVPANNEFTLTATLGNAGASGTVQFKDGNADLGSPVPVNAGVATAVGSFASGPRTIRAEYSGDNNFGAGTSANVSANITAPAAMVIGIIVDSGNSQSANSGSAFSTSLRVLVRDQAGIPIGGAGVSFAAPATGAGASFTPATTTTDTDGYASVSATANGTGGAYSVVATVTAPANANPPVTVGTATASFSLTNVAIDPNADSDDDGVPNGVEITEGLNANVKDNDVFNNSRAFVMQQYRDFLGREGDNGGITFWRGAIDSSQQTRQSMIELFTTSGEYDSLTAPMARLYFGTYLRIPDYLGLLFWTDEFRSGRRTLDNISQAFATAPEFVARYGNPSNRDYVNLLFSNILGRAPDQAGSDFWTSQLDSNQLSRGQMLNRFTESTEYKTRRAGEIFTTLVYAAMLRRAPNQATFDATVARINAAGNSTAARQAEVNTLLPLPEYRSRFLP